MTLILFIPDTISYRYPSPQRSEAFASRGFALEEGTAMFLVDGEMVQLVELRHQVAGHDWLGCGGVGDGENI